MPVVLFVRFAFRLGFQALAFGGLGERIVNLHRNED